MVASPSDAPMPSWSDDFEDDGGATLAHHPAVRLDVTGDRPRDEVEREVRRRDPVGTGGDRGEPATRPRPRGSPSTPARGEPDGLQMCGLTGIHPVLVPSGPVLDGQPEVAQDVLRGRVLVGRRLGHGARP